MFTLRSFPLCSYRHNQSLFLPRPHSLQVWGREADTETLLLKFICAGLEASAGDQGTPRKGWMEGFSGGGGDVVADGSFQSPVL